MSRPLATAAVVLCAALAWGGPRAVAEKYYTRTEKTADGEVVHHFTNIKPRGKAAGGWKLALDDGTIGKAAARRGGCKGCDRVPAKDRTPERYNRYDAFIYEASALYAIPVPLIRAVIKTESDYDPRVVSSVGARGLMQLMPAVVSDMGVSNVHDPRENILGGTRLLRILANRYDGDLVRTIAAYHAGPGNLARYGNNVPPFPRTRGYLRKVLDRYYKNVERQKTELAQK